MPNKITDAELENIIKEQDESETLEYKTNFEIAERIGEYISALGNSALMLHKPFAYMIWGVHDTTKTIEGTKFNPFHRKVSTRNQMPFITFIEQFLDPHINLYWEEHKIQDKRVLLLIINVSRVSKPISFKGKRFIRVGTSNKNLSEFPEKERLIWEAFESVRFESKLAKEKVTLQQMRDLLDISPYENLFNPQLSETELLKHMANDNLIRLRGKDQIDITNLCAYAFAKNMNEFPALRKRTIRITKYSGNQKLDKAIYDAQGKLGIILSFKNVVANVMRQIPYTENYNGGIRKDIPMFPEIAIRELIANALVHQDFTIEGMSPTIEIFKNKIVFTNPGVPLIPAERFLDVPPVSRNKDLADLMGKFHIVESRGTGIDKVVNSLEQMQLPALDINVPTSRSTIITIRSKKKFKDMSISERNNSIYWSACLRYVADEQINNKSIRDTFGLTTRDSSLVSKAISNAVEANLIKVYDPEVGRKFSKYIPFWGKDTQNN